VFEHRFVVAGAFQALNAVEARHAYAWPVDECELVFLLPPQPRAESETRSIIADSEWSHVREVGPPSASVRHWMQRIRNGRRLADDAEPPRHVVLGDYQTQLGRHVANCFPTADVVVLDDGQATLRVNSYRVARAEGRRPPRLHPQVPRLRYEAQRVAGRLLGLDLGDVPSVTFFTLYDIDPAPSDHVIRNRFEWLHQRFGTPVVDEDMTLFLGTPLVEQGVVTAATYVTMLRRLREQVSGELWYRPHPREDATRVAALISQTGAVRLELDTIVEYGLLAAACVPARIVSTHSSALDSLRVVLGDAVTASAIPLPTDLVAPRWRDWIARAYAEMDTRLGVPVPRLELL
jgi:hypothetical protein